MTTRTEPELILGVDLPGGGRLIVTPGWHDSYIVTLEHEGVSVQISRWPLDSVMPAGADVEIESVTADAVHVSLDDREMVSKPW